MNFLCTLCRTADVNETGNAGDRHGCEVSGLTYFPRKLMLYSFQTSVTPFRKVGYIYNIAQGPTTIYPIEFHDWLFILTNNWENPVVKWTNQYTPPFQTGLYYPTTMDNGSHQHTVESKKSDTNVFNVSICSRRFFQMVKLTDCLMSFTPRLIRKEVGAVVPTARTAALGAGWVLFVIRSSACFSL